MATTDNRGTGKDKHVGKGVRDRALKLVPQQFEVAGYVIQVDSGGRNETRDIEPTRHVDEARQASRARAPVARWQTSSIRPGNQSRVPG